MEISGKRYAIIVGVSNYSPEEHLKAIPYAMKDAERLSTILEEHCGFDEERIKLLTETVGAEAPTRANVLNSLKYVAKAAQPEDLVLVFFAGHGVEISSTPYVLTADTRMNVVRETAIEVSDINSILEESKAQCIVRVFDACRSPFSEGRGAVERMTQVMEETIFSSGEGWATLSSCSSGEVSYETGEFEQGVFSYYLCEGLCGNAANQEGVITLESLVDYVKISLRNWSDAQTLSQTPHFQSDISGVTEFSRSLDDEPPSADSESSANHPLQGLRDGIHKNLAGVPNDARHLSFTDDEGMAVFSKLIASQINGFIGSFTDSAISLTTSVPKNGALQNIPNAWSQFQASLKSSGVSREFTSQTKAVEIHFAGNEVLIPESRLVISTVRFSFFYWIWYFHHCEVSQLHGNFRPDPPKVHGFFTLKHSAAADPTKTESTIREIFSRSSEAVVDWNHQLCGFVDDRLAPLRSLDSIVE